MHFSFPKIYPILDRSYLPTTRRAEFLERLGGELAAAGVRLLEYRNKKGTTQELLAEAARLRSNVPAEKMKLILDDRVDLIESVEFDGVHVDEGDLAPAEARRLLGPGKIIGTFGGSDAMLPGILSEPMDYWSIGPVFSTTTKKTAKTPIGVEGVRRLRQRAGLNPVLVAVGGVTLQTARAVLEAGATTVAVSAAIFKAADPVTEFRRWLAELE